MNHYFSLSREISEGITDAELDRVAREYRQYRLIWYRNDKGGVTFDVQNRGDAQNSELEGAAYAALGVMV